jgi:hypothetical protein
MEAFRATMDAYHGQQQMDRRDQHVHQHAMERNPSDFPAQIQERHPEVAQHPELMQILDQFANAPDDAAKMTLIQQFRDKAVELGLAPPPQNHGNNFEREWDRFDQQDRRAAPPTDAGMSTDDQEAQRIKKIRQRRLGGGDAGIYTGAQ